MNAPADLWAITSYYNPARYRRRLANYRVFRRHLNVPLLAVELAFDADFDLRPEDADILVQLRGGDVLWQKERLLNIALAALPDECRAVVWLDCDIVFERDDWPAGVRRALDDFALVQPFSRVGHVASTASLTADVRNADIVGWQSSLAFAIDSGQSILDGLRLSPAILPLSASALPFETEAQYWQRRASLVMMGFAWAARRELLQQFGLYDGGIIGGGDSCIAGAAYGCFNELACKRGMTLPERQRYSAWADAFHRAVGARVTHIDGTLYHLWHGDLRDRQYPERHQHLRRYHFDPFQDIALADNQVWRWNSDKPLLHQFVRDYFASRKEDG
jgi:hypothetical protein